MDEEGNHEPEQAKERSHSVNDGSLSAAHSAAYPALSNNIQSYRHNASHDEAHKRKGQDRHENREAAHKRILPAGVARNASRLIDVVIPNGRISNHIARARTTLLRCKT